MAIAGGVGAFIGGVFDGMDWRDRRDSRKKRDARDDKRFDWEKADQNWNQEQRDWAREDRPVAKERDEQEWDWRVEDRTRARSRADAASARAAAERRRVEGYRTAIADDMTNPSLGAGMSVIPAVSSPAQAAPSAATDLLSYLRGPRQAGPMSTPGGY
jgi:hypothetical protein